MGFGCKEQSHVHKNKRKKPKGFIWTSLRPYEFVQGLELEINRKSELEENFELIRDIEFHTWKLAKSFLEWQL